MMPMHDHERPRKRPLFCRHYREICCEGWVPSMGEDANHVRPICNGWVSVFVKDPLKNQIREIHDCIEQWTPDLLQQVAQEVYQGAAATEGVRNCVGSQAHVFKRMGIAFQALARKNGVTFDDVKQIEMEEAKAEAEARKALEQHNKGGEGHGTS